jgi:hypothetical protein
MKIITGIAKAKQVCPEAFGSGKNGAFVELLSLATVDICIRLVG